MIDVSLSMSPSRAGSVSPAGPDSAMGSYPTPPGSTVPKPGFAMRVGMPAFTTLVAMPPTG